MSFADAVKAVVGIKALEEKVAKLSGADTQKDKSDIGSYRVSITQKSNGGSTLPNHQGNEAPIDGVKASGDIATAIVNAYLNAVASPTTTTTATDSGIIQNGSAGISSTPAGSALSDLSSSADSTVAQGGSSVLEQAQQGAQNTNLQTLLADAQALGATDEQLASITRKFLGSEVGVMHAQDLADADPVSPKASAWTSFPAGAENLRGIIGFDKDGDVSPTTGEVFAVQVRLGGHNTPIPTAADQSAEGVQATPWTTSTAPELLGFQLGFYWTASNPAAAQGATPEQAATNSVEAVKLIFPDPYPIGYGDAYWDVSTLSQTSDTVWRFTWYQGPGAGGNNVPINRATCPGAVGSCPASAPVYTAWPKTGAYLLSYTAGLVAKNEYDSEVPFRISTGINTTGSGIIEMAIGDGTNVIDDRLMRIEPGNNGTYLLSIISPGDVVDKVLVYDLEGRFLERVTAPADIEYWRPR